jgi:CAAX prenyl protease-like protein
MDHDQRPGAARRIERRQDFVVAQAKSLIGHEDLQRGVTVFHQGRQVLAEHLGPDTLSAWAFLAVRGLGPVVVVPIIEELFLRGFLMRYVIKEEFWQVPFGLLTAASAAACTVYAVATHPGEAIAAVGWFAIVSGIAAATRRPIDCILCHAATNLALGAYVLATGEWWLV